MTLKILLAGFFISLALMPVVHSAEAKIYGVLLEPDGKGSFILTLERAPETCPEAAQHAMFMVDRKGHYRGAGCWEIVHKVNVLISVKEPQDMGSFIAPIEAVTPDSKIRR